MLKNLYKDVVSIFEPYATAIRCLGAVVTLGGLLMYVEPRVAFFLFMLIPTILSIVAYGRSEKRLKELPQKIKEEVCKEFIHPHVFDACYEYDHKSSQGIITASIALRGAKNIKGIFITSFALEITSKPFMGIHPIKEFSPIKQALDDKGDVFFQIRIILNNPSECHSIENGKPFPSLQMNSCVVETNAGRFEGAQDRIAISDGHVLGI